MARKIGPHLEMLGHGAFRLLGDLPEGAVDAHLHLGTYLRMPVLGGMNLTGPGNWGENLLAHLSELRKHGRTICEGLRELSPAALEGVVDVPLLKTELRGPACEPVHLFTAMDGLFDRDRPCYLRVPEAPSLSLLRDLGSALKGFPGALREANLANLLRYMEAYGLRKAVALPVESGRFSRFSRVAMDACEGSPAVVPFFSVHPRHPDMEAQFTGYVRQGGQGLKFHPEFQGVAPDSLEAMHLFELCAGANIPAVCHVGGVKPGAAHSHPRRYEEAVRLFREVTFILCHVGLADSEDTLEVAARNENVLLETSGQPVEGLRRAAERVGTGRILFGSDWPLYHPAVPMSCVLEAFPRDADRERVFRDNVSALMGWKPEPGPASRKAAAAPPAPGAKPAKEAAGRPRKKPAAGAKKTAPARKKPARKNRP